MKPSRRSVVFAAALLGVLTTGRSRARADNPIVQTNYTADPAPLSYNGRIYLYTGHDEDTLVNNFFTMNEWRVYSSADIVNWTDHGSPLRFNDFSWSKGDAWAGQVIDRGGKFYYYVPTTSASLGRMTIGVGVSDSPIGPFKDAIGHALITENCGDIDPTVYIDDDGQAYLYWGNPNLCYVKLNQDMISYQGSVVHVPMTVASFGMRVNDTSRPTSYEEGPWFYRRNNLYYLVFAAGPISEHIGYATSTGPTGPWRYGGVVMPTQGASFTNHPGVIDYMGNSYFFYHNGALPGGDGYHRSVSVERFTYNADGTIPMMNMTTQGAPQIGTLTPYVQVEAETIAWESGIETEKCSEGGMDVTSISNGDYIKVKGVAFGTGAVSFDARLASATSGGSIELRLDSQTGTLLGTCSVPVTGGAQTWMTRTCPVSGASGTHDLYLRFTGGSGSSLFNFNWWRFTPRDAPDGGSTATGGTDGGASDGGGGGTGGVPGGSGGATGTGGGAAGGGGRGGAAGGTSGAGGTAVAASGGAPGTGGSALGTGGNVDRPGSGGAGGGTGGAGGCACRSVPGSDATTPCIVGLIVVLAAFSRRRRPPR